jgi:integrase
MRKFTGEVSEPRKITTRGGGVSYQFRYTDRGGVERAVNKPTLTEAVMAAENMRRLLREGGDPNLARQPAGPAMLRYLLANETDPDLARRRKALLINLRVHVIPKWEGTPFQDITAGAIETWVRKDLAAYRYRGRPLRPSSVRNIHAALSTFMAWAVREGIITTNPCRQAKCEALPKNNIKYVIPDDEQVAKLCLAMPDRLQIMLRLAAFAGLRNGEVRGLQWDDVDPERNRLIIRRQLLTGGKRTAPEYGPPKARSWSDDPEEVEVHPDLIKYLAEHRAIYGDNRWNLVVATATGMPVEEDDFNKTWRRVREQVGLSTKFHELRHYSISVMLRGGATPVEAAKQARHRDGGALICRKYAHIIGDNRSKSVAALRPTV